MTRPALLVLAALSALAFRARPAAITGPELHLPKWALVTDELNNEVKVVDLGAAVGYPVISTISDPTFQGPAGIVVSQTRRKAYVANQLGTHVSVIDIPTLTIDPMIDLQGFGTMYTYELALSPDERWLWITGVDDTNHAFLLRSDLNAAPNAVIDWMSTANNVIRVDGIAVRPGAEFGKGGSTQVYLTTGTADSICQVTYPTGIGNPTSGVELPMPRAFMLDVSPDGSKLYFTQNTGPAPAASFLGTSAPLSGPPTPLGGLQPGVDPADTYYDVKFSPGAPSRAFISQVFPISGELTILSLDPASNALVGSSGNGTAAPVRMAIDSSSTLLLACATNQVMVYRIDNPSQPAEVGAVNAFFNAAFRVAIADATTTVRLYDAYPRAFVATDTTVDLDLFGAGFTPACTVAIGPTAGMPATFIDSTHLKVQASVPGPVNSTYDVTVSDSVASTTLPGWLLGTQAVAFPGSFTIPPGTGVQDYRMFSLPQITQSSDLKDAMVAAFGPYNPTLWRAFLWSPRDGRYLEFEEIPDSPRDLVAASIWILSKKGGTVTVPGLDCLPGMSDFGQVIYPGWNMVAWPYASANGFWAAATAYTKIGFQGNNANAGETDPASNEFGDGHLFEWTGSAYALSTVMVPGRGYWVFNRLAAPCYLYFDDTGSSGTMLRPAGPDRPDFGDERIAPGGLPVAGRGGLLCGPDLSGPLGRATALMSNLPPPPPGQGLGAKSKTPTCAAPDAELSAGGRAAAAAIGMVVLVLLGRRLGKGLLR